MKGPDFVVEALIVRQLLEPQIEERVVFLSRMYLDVIVARLDPALDADLALEVAMQADLLWLLEFSLANTALLFPEIREVQHFAHLCSLKQHDPSLDVLGPLELPEPASWHVPLLERVFGEDFPPGLPAPGIRFGGYVP